MKEGTCHGLILSCLRRKGKGCLETLNRDPWGWYDPTWTAEEGCFGGFIQSGVPGQAMRPMGIGCIPCTILQEEEGVAKEGNKKGKEWEKGGGRKSETVSGMLG